jgi:hypothetical protein
MESNLKDLDTNNIESRKVLRSFGILMGSVFLIISIILFVKGAKWWICGFGSVALVFFLLGLIDPLKLNAFHKKWMRFAEILGAFNMKVILGVVYMVCFSSLGLVFRIIGKDPMNRKFDDKAASYWVTHSVPEVGSERYEKQY